MSAHRDEFLELCAGHALGALDPADRARLEAHLAEGCPVCEAELASLREAASLLAAGAPQHRAPAALRSRVMSAVRAEAAASPRPAGVGLVPLPRRPRPAPAWAWAAAAAAAALAVALFASWRDVSRLHSDLASVRGQVATLGTRLEDEQRWAGLAEAPGARLVELQKTPAGPAGPVARVTWDPGSRRALFVGDHFAVPEGKDYQLWAISSSGPTSLGLLRADAAGHVVARVPDAGDSASLGAFAISLEARGGAPTAHAPTGPVTMVGKIGG